MRSDEHICWCKFIEEGDINALSQIYLIYVEDLFLYGTKIHPDKHLVKDAIQQVFTHIIEKQGTLKYTDRIKAYLFKSLRNQVLEELRTKNRKSNIESLIARTDDIIISDPEQELILKEKRKFRKKIVNCGLQNLSEYQREAIFLKYGLNYSYDEIAEIFDIDIASARTLIYRSLKKLKTIISESYLLD